MKLYSLQKIEPGMVLGQDVYLADDAVNVFMAKGAVLTEAALVRLSDKGIRRVYIDTDRLPGMAAPAAPAVLRPAPPRLAVARSRYPIARPAPIIDEQLRQDALETLERTFADVAVSDNGIFGSREEVRELEGVVERLVSSLMRQDNVLLNIQDLKSYDDYTYHHSLSVSVLSIGIGQHLGMATLKLRQLGLAAIMHDIGKTALPIELIQKPARLSTDEYRLVQTHSTAGTSYLIGTSVGDERLWRAVLHHHERVDGKGYPRGLRGNEVPFWSRIISVADVYDALTSERPYRTAMQPAEALEYIMGGVGSSFDYDIVAALVRKVDMYPVGSCIELSNGRLAIVLDNGNQMRPVVELVGTGEIVDLSSDRPYLSVVVNRIVPDHEVGQFHFPRANNA